MISYFFKFISSCMFVFFFFSVPLAGSYQLVAGSYSLAFVLNKLKAVGPVPTIEHENLADIPSVPGSSVIRHHVSLGDFVLTSAPASVLSPTRLPGPLPPPSSFLRLPVCHLCPHSASSPHSHGSPGEGPAVRPDRLGLRLRYHKQKDDGEDKGKPQHA